MDTILLNTYTQKHRHEITPHKWVFTSLEGQVQFKDISSQSLETVMKAFLANLNQLQNKEMSNDVLVSLFDQKCIDFITG